MKRVLLKLSGEALAGDKHMGFDEPTVTKVAKQVKEIVDAGLEVSIVIGGGNFWRGRSSENIDRTKADQIGMLATVMNCRTNGKDQYQNIGADSKCFCPGNALFHEKSRKSSAGSKTDSTEYKDCSENDSKGSNTCNKSVDGSYKSIVKWIDRRRLDCSGDIDYRHFIWWISLHDRRG